jgi:hypothetical protein
MAGCAAFPAINPYVYYGLERADHFVHMQQFLELRAGTMHVLGKMSDEGLVQLPSFHTILAIMVTYNLRHSRWLLSIAGGLNGLLIVSCPTEGSHYLIDLIAGAAVAGATIGSHFGLEVHWDRYRYKPTHLAGNDRIWDFDCQRNGRVVSSAIRWVVVSAFGSGSHSGN